MEPIEQTISEMVCFLRARYLQYSADFILRTQLRLDEFQYMWLMATIEDGRYKTCIRGPETASKRWAEQKKADGTGGGS